ncbi:MAG: 7-carboxy-7-deazaguanine synthase QueE [Bacteroidaceae bacterium]|nr:7-carboxy-7-deazaguanine synthase QueE [Bacteroidaceae bacterium]
MSWRVRTIKPPTRLRINEIFCSIQGEGHFTGTPAVFIRTSGCNLHCSFCDTHHEEGWEMSVSEIVIAAASYKPRHVVITGGEPALQKELSTLVDALHEVGFFVQIETNGTCNIPSSIDWVTCSPKILGKTVIRSPHELKVIYTGEDLTPWEKEFLPKVWSLQPCDTGDAEKNAQLTAEAVRYCIDHPQWHLSLQTHKFIGVR